MTMKTLKTLGLLSLLLLSTQSLLSAEEVTLKQKKASVGWTDLRSESFLMSNKLTISSGGKVVREVQQTNFKDFVTKLTVLAVDGDKVTKVKVEVIKKESKAGMGKPVLRKSPHTGKSFVLEQKGDKVTVTEGDKAVPENLAAAIEKDYGSSLGAPTNKFLKMLPGSTMKVGESVPVKLEAARAFIADEDRSPFKLKSFELKLTGTKTVDSVKVAVFEVHAKFSGSEGTMVMGYELKGPIEVGIDDSLPRLVDLNGPVAISAKDSTREMKGVGTLKTKVSNVYSMSGQATSKPSKEGRN
ncbi:MAG: hypothetical protein P1V97_29655 [Planctomycetota bacterium]|nr:hypothetical protein [Planctomycetota bacterium]